VKRPVLSLTGAASMHRDKHAVLLSLVRPQSYRRLQAVQCEELRLTRVRGVPIASEAVTPSMPMRVPVEVFFSVSPRQQQ
jgi:hypothetical protein